MTSKDFDLEKLESKKEVFIAEDQAFEAPAKEFVPGPYYKNIEEVMPELSEFNAQDDNNVDSKSKLPVDRRDFMRLFGASAIMASTACVRRPVERAVPYVNQPNDMTIGLPIHYATTLEGAGVIVKTREGRPVFLEGNPEHPLSQGAVGSMALSELQALYHPDRRKSPEVLLVTTERTKQAGMKSSLEWRRRLRNQREWQFLLRRLPVVLQSSIKNS